MKVEMTSQTWTAIKEHVDGKMTLAMNSLETKGAPDADYWRGYIKALREIEALAGNRRPKFEQGAADYGV